MRTISFEPLWKTLEEKQISRREMAERADISRSTLHQLAHNESVTLETILKIYEVIESRHDSQSSNSI